MSLKILARTIVIILGFSAVPTQAAQNISNDDIRKICNRVADVCVAACRRKDNFSGQLSESLCIDDCIRAHTDCLGPVDQQFNNGNDATIGTPEDGSGTLYQGQTQKKKKRKKAPPQP
jgi:hypothetical protein